MLTKYLPKILGSALIAGSLLFSPNSRASVSPLEERAIELAEIAKECGDKFVADGSVNYFLEAPALDKTFEFIYSENNTNGSIDSEDYFTVVERDLNRRT